MGRQLERRGPDDQQIHDDETLSLVFRRLSIVDIRHGRQPFYNEDRSVVAVVNGEIYNHQELRGELAGRHGFATASDCEVVLHLYEERGLDFLSRLNGMFAIALWDIRRQRLLLARDRLGIKPLFIARNGSQLLFGSELKALLVHPDCPNEFDWDGHGDTRTSLGSRLNTYVRGVEALPGGHYLLHDRAGSQAPRAYWRLEDSFAADPRDSTTTPADWTARYAELIQDSVKLQLQGEAEVGVFLSGGLDSSLMVSLAAPELAKLHTFSMVDRAILATGDCHRAAGLAQRFRTAHHPVLFDGATLLDQLGFTLSSLEGLIATVELPFFGIEFLYKHELHRYAKTHVPNLKVMLLGQGADEFCGGYSRQYGSGNHPTHWADYLARLRPGLKQSALARRRVGQMFQDCLEESQFHPRIAGQSSSETNPALAAAASAAQQDWAITVTRLQNYNLWHEDRTASSLGIEARVPFLDHRLVELLVSIPAIHHPRLFLDKRIEREAALPWLGSGALTQPKVGFIISSEMSSVRAFHHDLVQRLFPAFDEAYLDTADALFSRPAVHQLFRQEQREFGNGTANERLLFVMTTAIFHRLLRQRAGATALDYARPPSPLAQAESLSLGQWKLPLTPAEARWWTPERRVGRPPGISLLQTLSLSAGASPKTLYLGRGDRLLTKWEVPSDQPWLLELVRLLAAETHCLRVDDLATRLSLPPDKLAHGLADLFVAGMLLPDLAPAPPLDTTTRSATPPSSPADHHPGTTTAADSSSL
jgi:asparagine synthase (glutamine-hydrolysing)